MLHQTSWKFQVVILFAVLSNSAFAPASERPNVILILADDLGYGDLGCYGQARIQTPHLDQLAAEGMRFTQFYAGSTVCAPSRCVLMTGRHVGHATIRGNGDLPLPVEEVTLADLLKPAGYANGMIGKWGLGSVANGGDPLQQGFDYFVGYLQHRHAHNYYPSYLFRNRGRFSLGNLVPNEDNTGAGVATKKVDYTHDLFAAEALELVDRHHDGPFFLYLALTIPHANNEARAEGMEVPDQGQYREKGWPEAQRNHAAMISRMDADLGELFARLKAHGIDEKTVVMFTSDNGPHREGGNDPDFQDSNGPLRGIKRDLYEGGIRVPLIVRWPGQVAAHSTSDYIGSFADFLPTLADLAGVESPPGIDGQSFLPALIGQPQSPHPYLYWEFYEGAGGAQAVRAGKWKAVRKPAFDGAVELYDLDDDLAETRDVASQHPEIVVKMAERMREGHLPTDVWKVRGRRQAAGRQ